MSRTPVRVLFRVAAGSRQGFGHLVRTRVLSRALGIRRPVVSVRGGSEAVAAAARLGCTVMRGAAPYVLESVLPSVVVIDDPTAAQARLWTRAAWRRGIPTASIHDLGRGFCAADLSVDGSLVRTVWPRSARTLTGPRFTILDPQLRDVKGTPRDPSRVLIALGGGPRVAVARRLAAAILKRRPGVTVRIAAGFVPRSTGAVPGVAWLAPQPGLARELARCSAALVGGGVSLYEAVAIDTPTAVWPVVQAQLPTARAFVRRSGVIGVWPGPRRIERAAEAVCALLDRPPARTRLFDARGAGRVADAVRQLAAQAEGGR